LAYIFNMPGPSQSFASRDLAAGFRIRHRGFTLVEMLVVIGIIALLIALLMPALSGAVEISKRTACAAKLQQQLLAAQIHALDHHGYYPLAGVISVAWPPPAEPPDGLTEGLEPSELDDAYSVKYDYLSFPFAQFQQMLAPINVSLGSEMSFKSVLSAPSNDSVSAAEADDNGLGRIFLCPSQATSTSEITQPPLVWLYVPPPQPPATSTPSQPTNGGGYIVWDTEPVSYFWNECILGWGSQQSQDFSLWGIDASGRLHGRASGVRQASKTMFVADGLGGNPNNSSRLPYITGSPMATVYNADYNGAVSPPITLADAYLGTGGPDDKAGDNENFDMHRHRGKINIGFCDGHVETRNITVSDLSSVFLMAP
jgi:prepilin-type N-terminal cleavage/methylation domain-containing protein/prepilin-type processing-associated H-X9-DG protein